MNQRVLRRHLLVALTAATSGCSWYEWVDKRVVPVSPSVRLLPTGPQDAKTCEQLLDPERPLEGEVLWCQAVEPAVAARVVSCKGGNGRAREVALPSERLSELGAFDAESCTRVCRSGTDPPDYRAPSCELREVLDASLPQLLVATKRVGEKAWNPFSGVSLVRTWQGRRPSTWEEACAGGFEDTAGARFAEAARLEAAAVVAFRELEAELAHLGAPFSLLAACRHAAKDEARHARAVTALAERWGGVVAACTSRPAKPGQRSLEDLCLENLVEGCMGEAFAAALAEHQARAAKDASVRRVARPIALEEAGHAALGFQVHAWLLPRLGHAQRARVAERFEAALEALRESASAPVPHSLEALGFLGGEPARRLHAALRESLWQPLLEGLRSREAREASAAAN